MDPDVDCERFSISVHRPHTSLAKQLQELHDNLSPAEFERLVHVLLEGMEFVEIRHTGKSGDEGVDLQAVWNQVQVPELDIDLHFVIQVKRFNTEITLNPRLVRELRGSLKPGEWGLLITSARVSPQTRQSGLKDPTGLFRSSMGAS